MCPGKIPTSIELYIKNAATGSLVVKHLRELIELTNNQLVTKEKVSLNKSIDYEVIIEFYNEFGKSGAPETIIFIFGKH